MRRRPNRLKVSTFPFLAVLLCAMEALILFLVVFDRRAKIVARNKAVEHNIEMSRDREKEIARRWEEWDRQRQELQSRLQQQHQDLVIAKRTIDQEKNQAVQELNKEKTQQQELQDNLAKQTAAVQQAQQELASDKTQLESTAAKNPKAVDEIVRLGFEVKELEETLNTLKEQQRQGQNTYSLVPYKGKQGVQRQPIYVEVSGAGLIFHPDRKEFATVWLDSDMVRTEVVARLEKLERDAPGSTDKSARPYVFFIVRPEGIENYYKAQTAMRRLEIDYGYEFVESDWTLDFGATDAAEKLAKLSAKSGVSLGTGTAPPRQPGGTGHSGSAASIVNQQPGGTGSAQSASIGFGMGSANLPPAAGDPLTELPPIDGPFGGLPPSTGGSAGTRTVPGTPVSSSATIGAPGMSDLPPETIGSPASRGSSGQPLSSPSFVPANRPQVMSTDSLPPTSEVDTVQLGTPAATVVGSTPPGTTAGQANPQSPPVPLANQLLQRMTEPKTTPTGAQANASPTTTTAAPSGQNRGEPGDHGSPERSALPEPPAAPGSTTAQRPRKMDPPISRLIGNRDFVVTIECKEEGVVVWPGGKTFASAGLLKVGRDNDLAREVNTLIQHRQATVANGEPPYRPEIRFRIQPEGRRSFFLAYPLLEELGVAMTREDANQ